MKHPYLYCLVGLFSLLLAHQAGAQAGPGAEVPLLDPSLEFVANQGQWPAAIRYAAAVPGGHLCLEPGGLRYVLLELPEHPHTGSLGQQRPAAPKPATALRGHQLRVQFVGADASTPLLPATPTTLRRNYLRGNDPAHWASNVPGYRQVRYQAPWPGVGARFYENAVQNLEYDFEVAAGADPRQVRLRYEGATSLRLSADGQLHVGTTLGELTELLPLAYQTSASGQRQPVACRYRLDAATSTVSFELGRYDHARPLVIDPKVIFSTYSGSKANNWGFTATYDNAGNLYSGGIVLDDFTTVLSYPTTPGAFQTTFGGVIDIAIQKFNPSVNGKASLVWATYLGGSQADFPSSLVVNSQNELVVLGTTASANYPTTPGAVQRTYKGGTYSDVFGDYGSFYGVSGSDIVVTRLSADGSSLAASTYLGGSGNDGLVPFDPGSSARQLPQNYGDPLRGDVLTDDQGNIYVASTSSSTDFPVTAGSFGALSHGGTSDAVLCKLPADMRSLSWSGYLGGSAADGAYSVQLAADGSVYAAGGTLSASLPGTAGALQPTRAGNVDGYVTHLSADGSRVLQTTFLGTSSYDQAFFVQIGGDGGVYVLGQTLGAWPVSTGVYSNKGSRQFISKLSATLDQQLLSTVFGSGSSTIDISPTAFLVDQCDRVYACGWGGSVNQSLYGLAAPEYNGYTDGMPTTANAVRRSVDTPGFGSDFYLAQFTPGLAALNYGTYYGNANYDSEGDHVDGGTSRFDPRGVVYAAVCSCFAYSGFPVPPGANTYASSNGNAPINDYGPQCNDAAFKLNFEPTNVTVGSNTTLCATSAPLALTGLPAGGIWSGPGVSGSVAAGYIFTPSPSLVGAQTLTYTLTGATAACVATGQQVVTVTSVAAPVIVAAGAVTTFCLQNGAAPAITLTATPAGGTFSGPGVSGNVFNPATAGGGIHTITYVAGAGTPCPVSSTVQLTVLAATAGGDFTLCANNGPVALPAGNPTGGTWTGPGVSGSVATGFLFTPEPQQGNTTQRLTYTVPSPSGDCVATAQVTASVVAVPQASATVPASVCSSGGAVALTGGQPAGGTWSGPGVTGSAATGFVFTPSAALAGPQVLTYKVLGNNICANLSTQATATITVQAAYVLQLPADTVICPGSTQRVRLVAQPAGGVWSGPGVSGDVFDPVAAGAGTFTLTYSIGDGTVCTATGTRRITVTPTAVLAALPQTTFCLQNGAAPTITLAATPAGGTFSGPGVSGSVFDPVAAGGGTHTVTYQFDNGTSCPSTTSVQLTVTTATAGPALAVCASNGPVALTSGLPVGGTWSGPGVSGSVATGFVFTPDPQLGNVTQQLTYSVPAADNSCVATAQLAALVSVETPAAVAALPSVCSSSGPLALAGGTPQNGIWSGAGVSGSVAAGFVFTPSAALAGTQTLTYTVPGNAACANLSTQASTTITVDAAYALQLPADTVLCPGSGQAFGLHAQPAGGTWTGPGVAGNVFDPAVAGAGTFTLTYSIGGNTACATSGTRRVTVVPAPLLAATLVPGACQAAAVAPYPVHYALDASSLPAGAQLAWHFGDDSTAVATGFDVTHTYAQAGTYHPRVTVSLPGVVCTVSEALPHVTVESMLIPNVFTPNGDHSNDVFKPRLGGCPPRLQVYSRWGQLVYEDAAYQNTWDGGDLGPGVYYYLLTPPDGSAKLKGWVELVR